MLSTCVRVVEKNENGLIRFYSNECNGSCSAENVALVSCQLHG
jgi:hypothetical protein